MRLVHPVDLEDPAALTALETLVEAGFRWPRQPGRLDRWRTTQPDGWVMAVDDDGSPVGCAAAIAYTDASPRFGWVGMVATRPGCERRGVGTATTLAVIDWLASRGCAPVLDASVAGAPVYERMGFVDHGIARALRFDGSVAVGASHGVAVLTDDLLDSACALDAECFGADRSRVIRAVAATEPGRGRVARSATGSVVGYGFAMGSHLGPVVATTEAALSSLSAALVEAAGTTHPTMSTSADSQWYDALVDLGWVEQRQLRHMRRGVDVLPGARDLLVAQVSFGEG